MSAHLEVKAIIDEFSLNDFTEKERVGSGGEGEVYRSHNDRLGLVAVKRFYNPTNKTDMSEVILLAKHANHPNIIRLYGLLTLEEGYLPNSRSFCIGYIMEYMENGSLYNVIHNTSVEYDMKQVYSWIEKASSGLQYLHEEGILHRDIKPQNILLGKSLDDLRISDFGLAKAVDPQTIASYISGIGSVDYMAPELYDGTKYGKSADIYSLTITFWEIIHRERPYAYMGIIPQYKQITRILNGERPNIPEELEISALLIRGWNSKPKSRPKISEFIEFSRKKRPAQENLRKVERILNGERPNIPEELEISALLIRGWDSNLESRPKMSEFIEFSRKKRPAQENLQIKEFSLNDFTEKQQIGRGGAGVVFRGYNDQLGKVAVKRLYKQVNKTDMSEVILLVKHSNHPNIIRLFGLLTPEEGYSPNSRSFCIGYIMECMERSLFDVIDNTSVEYDMKQVYSWIEKASSGLKYLHEEGVLHRDIKPQTILLGKSLDDLRISGFGLAKAVGPQTTSHTGGIGTIDYMAPELHNETKYGKPADIYALTITFWEIIHRKRPYAYMGVITLYKQITRILNGERPNIEGELEISALLIRGWDSNPESRPKISEFIEFSRKAQENLRKVVSQQNLQIQNEEEFNSPVRKRRKYLAQNVNQNENTSVLILGGWGDLNTIYLLDSKAQSWKKLRITLPIEMYDFGAVKVNEEIYIFGGFSKDFYQQGCYKLKNDGSWKKLASLNQKRSDISNSSLVYKGDIWAIGGYSGERLNSVEKYDISQDKWTYMPEMNYARYDAAAAVFEDQIFVTGGWNEKNLKSVEMFDPKLQKWLLFCDLPIEVVGHAMLISNSTLSIFGGSSGSDILNSVWEMDIEEKKWTKKQSFKHPRSYFGIGKLSNGIIVFGGVGSTDDTSSEEDINDEFDETSSEEDINDESKKTFEIFDGNNWIEGSGLSDSLSQFAYITIPHSLEKKLLEKFS